jgi:hypothetical protein
MNVTEQTTEADLAAEMTRIRKRISEAVLDRSHELVSEDLSRLVNGLAAAEGRYLVRSVLRAALRNGASPQEIRNHLTTLVLHGASDSWSGRENDTRRAHHDGLREEIRLIIFNLGGE